MRRTEDSRLVAIGSSSAPTARAKAKRALHFEGNLGDGGRLCIGSSWRHGGEHELDGGEDQATKTEKGGELRSQSGTVRPL